MIYLNRYAFKDENISAVKVLTTSQIKQNNVTVDDLSDVTDFSIVNTIKLYSGIKFSMTADEFNNLIITGDLTDEQYTYITKLLCEPLQHLIRNNIINLVCNIDEEKQVNILYGFCNTDIYLPHDIKAILGNALLVDNISIAASYRTTMYDVIHRATIENNYNHLIATDEKFLLKIINDNPINNTLDLIRQDVPAEHLDLATPEEMDTLIEYYENGKEHKNVIADYDIRYMRLAREFSTWSKDPSTQLGAVAISNENKIVLAQGYNGFPRGIEDDYRLYIRSLKYSMVVHAEMNMIFNAARNGTSLENSSVYIYGLPCCSECVKGLIQSKVKHIIMCDIKNDPRWNESFKTSALLLNEAGIEYKFIEPESLD